MRQSNRLGIRFISYFTGLFIMTIAIALSVKSNLGVSPVSSIPYSFTCILGIEMGNATILFHAGLVAVQILLLRRSFKLINLLQIPVGIVFGKFTTVCNSLVMLLPQTDNIAVRFIMMFVSTVLLAIGITIYMSANFVPLAVEGTIAEISNVFHLEFSKVKTGFDMSMVAISLVLCLLLIHGLGSIGVGTAISSVLVGTNLGFIKKCLGAWKRNLPEMKANSLQLTEEQ